MFDVHVIIMHNSSPSMWYYSKSKVVDHSRYSLQFQHWTSLLILVSILFIDPSIWYIGYLVQPPPTAPILNSWIVICNRSLNRFILWYFISQKAKTSKVPNSIPLYHEYVYTSKIIIFFSHMLQNIQMYNRKFPSYPQFKTSDYIFSTSLYVRCVYDNKGNQMVLSSTYWSIRYYFL